SQAQPVSAGGSAALSITVAPNPAPFNFSVGSFGCTNLPQGASCQFSPSSVNPGDSSATVSLTIITTSRTLAGLAPTRNIDPKVLQAWFPAAGFSIFVILALFGDPNWKKRVLLGLVVIVLISWYGCAGGGGNSENPNGTPAGTYSITVTAAGNGGTT